MDPVGILIVDDDLTSQRALRNILDAEGWRVRIVTDASQALAELATGGWNLAIINVAIAGPRSPLYALLKELAQAESASSPENAAPRKHIRILFLVPLLMARDVQPFLERDGLPYSHKPYHLHDFLERVSELLVESGAIPEPIRGAGGFYEQKKRRRERRFGAGTKRGAMFASRDDYQMSEEEMLEFERQEEDEQQRRKREKEKEKTPGSSLG